MLDNWGFHNSNILSTAAVNEVDGSGETES